MKIQLIILFLINIAIVLAGKCPPDGQLYPCDCKAVGLSFNK